ncbi:PREDICTED: uncharacterized protein LOC107120121 [Gekko japonicus]|uniref:Uncharacterized protein LOC107120121 n=1 Tax=Gekko japonicus TaxID=146911 RepID=A0ABM1KX17_GEKJA|nr:PREDICTED: uncharacterized protein LOC107120121 [Gekko japonicus]
MSCAFQAELVHAKHCQVVWLTWRPQQGAFKARELCDIIAAAVVSPPHARTLVGTETLVPLRTLQTPSPGAAETEKEPPDRPKGQVGRRKDRLAEDRNGHDITAELCGTTHSFWEPEPARRSKTHRIVELEGTSKATESNSLGFWPSSADRKDDPSGTAPSGPTDCSSSTGAPQDTSPFGFSTHPALALPTQLPRSVSEAGPRQGREEGVTAPCSTGTGSQTIPPTGQQHRGSSYGTGGRRGKLRGQRGHKNLTVGFGGPQAQAGGLVRASALPLADLQAPSRSDGGPRWRKEKKDSPGRRQLLHRRRHATTRARLHFFKIKKGGDDTHCFKNTPLGLFLSFCNFFS